MTARFSLTCALLGMAACAHSGRTGAFVGEGTAIVQARNDAGSLAPRHANASPWDVGSSMQLPAGTPAFAPAAAPKGQAPGDVAVDNVPMNVEARVRAASEARAAIEFDAARMRERNEALRISALRARIALRDRTVEHGANPARQLRGVGAPTDLQQERLDRALAARGSLRDRFLRNGALGRPPMPEAIAEVTGEPPYIDAVWIGGKWIWFQNQWTWQAGGWDASELASYDGFDDGLDEDRPFDQTPDLGVADTSDGVELGLFITLADGTRRPRVPHNLATVKFSGRIRDHRPSRIRDHRTSSKSTSNSSSDGHDGSSSGSGSSGSSGSPKADDPDAKNDASAGTFTHQR